MTDPARRKPGGGSLLGPYTGSVLLHLALFALFGLGWISWRRSAPPPAPQQLAIEAVVVDPQDVGLPLPDVQPEPQPVAESLPPPVPVRDAAEERRRAEALQRAEEQRKAQAERKLAEEREAEAVRKLAAERKVEAERKAQAERKAEADRKAEAERKAAEARLRAEREAELRRSMAAEERARAARASGAGAHWRDLIRAKIESEWRRPPTAQPGIECEVQVTQVPGGEVVAVRILACNGDAAVRQSIEIAVLSASPLPPPPDPSLFERNLVVVFKPND